MNSANVERKGEGKKVPIARYHCACWWIPQHMLINALLCLADYQGLWLYTSWSFKWRVAYSILKRKKDLYLYKPQLLLRNKCFAFSAIKREELPSITIFYHYMLKKILKPCKVSKKKSKKMSLFLRKNNTVPIVLSKWEI